jgi:hypothetical protein
MDPNAAPKLCKDCRHARLKFAADDDSDLSKCVSPRGYEDTLRLTDGKPVRVAKSGTEYCSVNREFGPCGPDAAWFEPITIQAAA